MTADPDQLLLPPAALGRIEFLNDLDPLPLIDPTEAARYLGVRRHTLACYRSLGEGPPYFKFGRWIRYAKPDLQRWRDGVDTLPFWSETAASDVSMLVATRPAARFLTVTRQCLANYRLEGLGPRYCRFKRRLHYPVDELRRWAVQQRHTGGTRVQSTPLPAAGKNR
jgi:hypothetical protein